MCDFKHLIPRPENLDYRVSICKNTHQSLVQNAYLLGQQVICIYLILFRTSELDQDLAVFFNFNLEIKIWAEISLGNVYIAKILLKVKLTKNWTAFEYFSEAIY